MKKSRTRPIKKAASLKYSSENVSPVMTAKGSGRVAERILEVAKEHNIPVREDPDLIHLLSKLEVNDYIPPDMYQVVAEVLAYVYSINRSSSKIGGS